MENKTIERNSSISLTKNSKGYTWDIKIYFDAEETPDTGILAKIDDINKKLTITYGG